MFVVHRMEAKKKEKEIAWQGKITSLAFALNYDVLN